MGFSAMEEKEFLADLTGKQIGEVFENGIIDSLNEEAFETRL